MLISKEFHFCIKQFFKHEYTPPFNRQNAPLDCSEETDLQILQDLRLQHRKNPLTGYLNINSLRKKMSDLRVLLHDLQLEYFVISETKLDDSFPSAQFAIKNYEIPDFGVSTAIMLSRRHLPYVVQVELKTLAWKR